MCTTGLLYESFTEMNLNFAKVYLRFTIRSVKLLLHVVPFYPSLPVFCPFTLVISHVYSTRSRKQSNREKARQ